MIAHDTTTVSVAVLDGLSRAVYEALHDFQKGDEDSGESGLRRVLDALKALTPGRAAYLRFIVEETRHRMRSVPHREHDHRDRLRSMQALAERELSALDGCEGRR